MKGEEEKGKGKRKEKGKKKEVKKERMAMDGVERAGVHAERSSFKLLGRNHYRRHHIIRLRH